MLAAGFDGHEHGGSAFAMARAEEWLQPNKGILLIALRSYPLVFQKKRISSIAFDKTVL